MDIAIEIASWALIVTGSFFGIVGGIGLIRLPDFYSRGHAAGMTDTMGAGCILLGLCLQAGWSLVTAKLIFILLFLFFTSPTASHALGKGAFLSGLKPITKHHLKGSKLDTANKGDDS